MVAVDSTNFIFASTHWVFHLFFYQPIRFVEPFARVCTAPWRTIIAAQLPGLCSGDLVNVLPVVGDVTGHSGKRHGGIHDHLGLINVFSLSEMTDWSR